MRRAGSGIPVPTMRAAIKLPIGQLYSNGRLKKYGAWEKPFATP
jgi:hypothetical protein